jgi:hypothetical protein
MSDNFSHSQRSFDRKLFNHPPIVGILALAKSCGRFLFTNLRVERHLHFMGAVT